jgi:phage repressor protein C with HTH and peptisase S24 domain
MAEKVTDGVLPPRQNLFTVKESGLDIVTQYCPEHPSIELLIPAEVRVIRRIVFKITSHDQGIQ